MERSEAIARVQEAEVIHRQWRRGLLLVGIAALTAVAVAVGLDHDRNGIEVVESGFARMGGNDVGFGAIVENTTDRTAYHTVACVQLTSYDVEHGGCSHEITIEVLLPGQRVGFGSVGSDTTGNTDFDVEVRPPAQWLDPEAEPYGEIVARDLLLAYSPEKEPVVSFVAELDENGRTVRNATAYAVFRDDRGDIVGGARQDFAAPLLPRQETRQAVHYFGTLPELATAEVYVFPSGV